MALEITVKAKTAEDTLGRINKSLDDAVAKIEKIDEAFASLNLNKVKELEKSLLKLSNLKLENKRLVESLRNQNEALQKQVTLLGVLTKAAETNTNKKKEGLGIDAQSIANKQAVNDLTQKEINMTAKLNAALKNQGKSFTNLIASQERFKIVQDKVIAATRLALATTNSAAKADLQKIANDRELLRIQEARVQSQAKLNAINDEAIRKTIQLTAKEREQVRLANDLANANAKLELSTSKDAIALKKVNAELKKLDPQMKKTTKNTKDLSGAMQAANKHSAEFRAALNALGAGFGIFTGATVFAAAAVFGVVKGLKEGITAFAQFDFAMDRATAVMEANRVETVQLRTTVRDLAKTTIFTAREVSEGLIFLGQAGQTTSEAMQTLEPTLRLAQIGMIGMQQAADQVTNVMAAFNIQATELSSVVDLLSVVVTSSNTNMSQLAKAISFVGPAAQATNTDLRDTAVILGFFANAGVKASRAGTALRRGLANLANPTDKLTKTLIKLGVTTIDPLTGRMKSMIEIIKDLNASGASLTDVFAIFGTRAGPAFAAAILGNAEALDELLKATENVEGATKRLAKRLEDNQISDFKKAMAAGEEALITFGESIRGVVGPVIFGLTTAMKSLANSISSIVPALGFAIKTFSLFFALGLLPKIAAMIGSFTSLTFAIGINTAAMKSGAASMGAMKIATQALSISASRLKFALRGMLGPIGLLITSGFLIFLGSTKTESEKLAESLEKSIEQLADLEKSVKAVTGKSFDLGTKDLSTNLGVVIDALEESKRALGPSITEDLERSSKAARSEIFKIRIEIEKLGKIQSKGVPIQQKLTKEEEKRKASLESQLDFNLKSLSVSKEALKIAKENGIENLTAAQALNQEAKKQKEIRDADKAALLKKQGAAGQTALFAELDAARKEADLARAGGTQTQEDLLKLNLKVLASEKAILEARISSGVLTEDRQAQAVSDLRGNLDKRLGLIKDFLVGADDINEEFKSRLSVNEFEGRFDSANVKTLLDVINEQVTGTTKSVAEAITKLVSVGNKAIIDLGNDSIKAEKIIEKARVTRAAEADLVELQRIDRFNKLKLAKDKNARDQGIAAVKTEFALRNVTLQEFVDATVAAEQKLGDATLKGLREKEALLIKNKVALDADLSSNNIAIETLKRLTAEIKANAKALADNKAAQDATTESTKAATESKKLFVSAFGKKAQEDADKFLRQQDVQIKSASGLAAEYLSTAESTLAYAIQQERLTTAFKANEPASLKLVALLEEQRKKMRGNSIQIRGLQDEWIESQQNMVGAALDATKQMQTAFEEFLINPTLKGFKDLGKAFLDLIAQILAKRAILSLFNGPGGNGGGLGDLFTGFFKGLGGSATGGSFRVGGAGGIDSQLFAQKVTPGEIITISNPNGGDDRKAERSSGQQVINFNNTVTISGTGDNKETERMIDRGLRQLEGRITRQQQRQQSFLGSR